MSRTDLLTRYRNCCCERRVLLRELLCVVPVAINSGDHLSQLRQLFVVVNEGRKRLVVVSLLSWRSLPLPRVVGSCPEVEKKDRA
jgi:hypothetical protein